MTIAAGLMCPDGIVLCADTQETSGTAKRYRPKLIELQLVSAGIKAVVVASTDDAVFLDGLIEKISENIDLTDGYIASARSAIEITVEGYCRDKWSLYASDRPSAELLIGLKTIDGLTLLQIALPNVRSVSTYEFIGYGGGELASYKAKQLGLAGMPTDTGMALMAYILQVVKDNVNFCGGDTHLSIIFTDGVVEHKSQEYIHNAVQGYKTLGWLLDTWVFPFLPLAVGNAGEDLLSMIGKLGVPNAQWSEKIPGLLKLLKDRKEAILAGEILAIPENKKRKSAVHGFSLAAKIIKNSAKELYAEDFISEKSNNTIQARYQKVMDLAEVIKSGMESPDIDKETIRESLDMLCLVFTSFESLDQIMFSTPEDEPKSRKLPKRPASCKKADQP